MGRDRRRCCLGLRFGRRPSRFRAVSQDPRRVHGVQAYRRTSVRRISLGYGSFSRQGSRGACRPCTGLPRRVGRRPNPDGSPPAASLEAHSACSRGGMPSATSSRLVFSFPPVVRWPRAPRAQQAFPAAAVGHATPYPLSGADRRDDLTPRGPVLFSVGERLTSTSFSTAPAWSSFRFRTLGSRPPPGRPRSRSATPSAIPTARRRSSIAGGSPGPTGRRRSICWTKSPRSTTCRFSIERRPRSTGR
jgi:hypothetical protein